MNYTYLNDNEKLVLMFDAIKLNAVPKKLTFRVFASWGFASSNDRGFLAILKNLNFISILGTPTADYFLLKDSKRFNSVLQDKLKKHYEIIFKDISIKSLENFNEIKDKFLQETGLSNKECIKITETFIALCRLCELKLNVSDATIAGVDDKGALSSSNLINTAKKDLVFSPVVKDKSTVLNLNISLPQTTDTKVYEAIFLHLKDLLK